MHEVRQRTDHKTYIWRIR